MYTVSVYPTFGIPKLEPTTFGMSTVACMGKSLENKKNLIDGQYLAHSWCSIHIC